MIVSGGPGGRHHNLTVLPCSLSTSASHTALSLEYTIFILISTTFYFLHDYFYSDT